MHHVISEEVISDTSWTAWDILIPRELVNKHLRHLKIKLVLNYELYQKWTSHQWTLCKWRTIRDGAYFFGILNHLDLPKIKNTPVSFLFHCWWVWLYVRYQYLALSGTSLPQRRYQFIINRSRAINTDLYYVLCFICPSLVACQEQGRIVLFHYVKSDLNTTLCSNFQGVNMFIKVYSSFFWKIWEFTLMRMKLSSNSKHSTYLNGYQLSVYTFTDHNMVIY